MACAAIGPCPPLVPMRGRITCIVPFNETSQFGQLAAQLASPHDIAQIRPPAVDGPRPTAVAAILRASDSGLDVLLIKRSQRSGDPWSGHIAMPGGRAEPSDPTLAETAARETLEEIGLLLDPPHALLIGALEPLAPRIHKIPDVSVQPLVWVIADSHAAASSTSSPLGTSVEVDAAAWVPITHLTDPHRRVIHNVAGADGTALSLPAIQIDLGVLWGITLRICEDLVARLEPSGQ